LLIRSSLFIAYCETTELLVPVNEPLNLIPLAVAGPVEGPRSVFVPLAWDGTPHTVSTHILPDLTAAVRLVAHDAAWAGFGATTPVALHRACGHQLLEAYRLVPLAWGQDQRQQLATALGSQVHFGTEAALAAA
jgi:hypothetical protein